VELRDVWQSEASHFTPWLAREANLSILSETLGLELELEAQEKPVGPFRADLLCKDIATNVWVLIENQLDRTGPITSALVVEKNLRLCEITGTKFGIRERRTVFHLPRHTAIYRMKCPLAGLLKLSRLA
jgi:hypothetical protein